MRRELWLKSIASPHIGSRFPSWYHRSESDIRSARTQRKTIHPSFNMGRKDKTGEAGAEQAVGAELAAVRPPSFTLAV
jgi:hypothetical protein